MSTFDFNDVHSACASVLSAVDEAVSEQRLMPSDALTARLRAVGALCAAAIGAEGRQPHETVADLQALARELTKEERVCYGSAGYGKPMRHQWRITGAFQPSLLEDRDMLAEFRCRRCGKFGWTSAVPGREPESFPVTNSNGDE